MAKYIDCLYIRDFDALNTVLAHARAFHMADNRYPKKTDGQNDAPFSADWKYLIEDIKTLTGFSIPQILGKKLISNTYERAATKIFNDFENDGTPKNFNTLLPKKITIEQLFKDELGVSLDPSGKTQITIQTWGASKAPIAEEPFAHLLAVPKKYNARDIVESYTLHIQKKGTAPNHKSGTITHGELKGKTSWLRIDCAMAFGHVEGIPAGTSLETLAQTEYYRGHALLIQKRINQRAAMPDIT